MSPLDVLSTPPGLVASPDQYMPSLSGDVNACPNTGCRYVITSPQDGRRHSELSGHERLHGQYVCNVCGLKFDTPHFLTKHRKESYHPSKRKIRQNREDSAARGGQGDDQEDEDDDE